MTSGPFSYIYYMSSKISFRMASDAVDLMVLGEIAAACDIDPADWTSVSADQVVLAVERARENLLPLRLYVNSPGGDLIEGLAIHDTLRAASAGGVRIVAHIFGCAASAATIVAFAADEVVMDPSSYIMIHEPRGATGGTCDEIEASLEFYRKARTRALEIYSARCGKPVAELSEMIRTPRWLTADEALSEGWTDRVEVAPLRSATQEPPAVPSDGAEPKMGTVTTLRAWARKLGLSWQETPAANADSSAEILAAKAETAAALDALSRERAERAALVAAEVSRIEAASRSCPDPLPRPQEMEPRAYHSADDVLRARLRRFNNN